MAYVFDTNSFRVLGHYFPNIFSSFWSNFDEAAAGGVIVSVREVDQELTVQGLKPHLKKWIKQHKTIFRKPGDNETEFVQQIFEVPHFRNLVNVSAQLEGRPVADPFVIAAAHANGGCVITEEKLTPNAARIPNVCQHFGIDCTDLEGFMEREGWTF